MSGGVPEFDHIFAQASAGNRNQVGEQSTWRIASRARDLISD